MVLNRADVTEAHLIITTRSLLLVYDENYAPPQSPNWDRNRLYQVKMLILRATCLLISQQRFHDDLMRLDSTICDFGWPAPPFTLSDPDGVSVSLIDRLQGKGLLIAFICNHCPYVHAVIDRLVDDIKTLQKEGINAIAVMPNDYRSVPADGPRQMKVFAETHGFTFPYLIDEDQSVARAYGAVCTPDFFGFNSSGELQYRGRLDDARMADPTNRTPELLNAMRLIAKTGEGPRVQKPSMGCSIKWR